MRIEEDSYIVTAKDRDGNREVLGEFAGVEKIEAVRFAKTVEKKHDPEIWERVVWDI